MQLVSSKDPDIRRGCEGCAQTATVKYTNEHLAEFRGLHMYASGYTSLYLSVCLTVVYPFPESLNKLSAQLSPIIP